MRGVGIPEPCNSCRLVSWHNAHSLQLQCNQYAACLGRTLHCCEQYFAAPHTSHFGVAPPRCPVSTPQLMHTGPCGTGGDADLTQILDKDGNPKDAWSSRHLGAPIHLFPASITTEHAHRLVPAALPYASTRQLQKEPSCRCSLCCRSMCDLANRMPSPAQRTSG